MADEITNAPVGQNPVHDQNTGQPNIATPQDNQPQQPSVIDQIDKDELSNYILKLIANDKADKEESLFKETREYDIRSYYGLKLPTSFPWINSSNFAVPLVPTMVDTALANIIGSIFYDPEETIEVDGVGPQDARNAKNLKSFLNWQMYSEIDAYDMMDKCVFLSLLQGTGIVKVYQDLYTKKVRLECIPMESIYLPLDARGEQAEDTDHIIQIVAWDDNDKEERKSLNFFTGIDDLVKGFNVTKSSLHDQLQVIKDTASGTKLYDRQHRDYYYVAECYLTYYLKPKNAKPEEPKKPVELIVWIAPNGGQIMAMVVNPFKKRPFVSYKPYPRDDRYWGMSIPEKIRQIQEELDYSHNQNINALDMAILPTLFYDEGSDFDPESVVQTPGGSIAVPDSSKMQWRSMTVNPGHERQEERYWDLASRILGLTDLFQSKIPYRKQTATLTRISDQRSEVRFKNIYQRYENSWDRMVDLIYYYDKVFFNDIKDKMVKVIGASETFVSAENLFPKGMDGNFSFKFSSSPISEKQVRKQNMIQLYEDLKLNPLVSGNPANMWRLAKKFAEALGFNDFEEIVTKPREVNIPSPEEAIFRIMGGELNLVPHPSIDADAYWWAIMLFVRTDTYKEADNDTKQAISTLLKRVMAIRRGQVQQTLDMQQLKAGAEAQAKARGQVQGNVPPMNGNGNNPNIPPPQLQPAGARNG